MQLSVEKIKALRWKPQLGSRESVRIAVQAMLAER
jgi:UDP-glucose 4-epimerase